MFRANWKVFDPQTFSALIALVDDMKPAKNLQSSLTIPKDSLEDRWEHCLIQNNFWKK